MSQETAVVHVFFHEQFGEIRTIIINGEIWFVAADVCRALEIKQPTRAVKRLKDNEKAEVNINHISSNGVVQARKTLIANEPGLYRLIFESRKPKAEKFQDWVFHEVLPSIRKTGAYSVNGMPSGNPYFPPELSKLWLNEKSAEALIQIAKISDSSYIKEKLLRKATIMLVDEDLFVDDRFQKTTI